MHDEFHLIQYRSPAKFFLIQDCDKWMLSRYLKSIFVAFIVHFPIQYQQLTHSYSNCLIISANFNYNKYNEIIIRLEINIYKYINY